MEEGVAATKWKKYQGWIDGIIKLLDSGIQILDFE